MFDIVINMNTSVKYCLTLAKFKIWQPFHALQLVVTSVKVDKMFEQIWWKVSCDVTPECTEPSRIAYLLPFGARQQATEQICIATQPIFILLQSVSSSRRPGETAWLMAVGWCRGKNQTAPHRGVPGIHWVIYSSPPGIAIVNPFPALLGDVHDWFKQFKPLLVA